MLAPIFVNEDEDITKGRQPECCAGGKDSEREGVKVRKRERAADATQYVVLAGKAEGESDGD